MTDNLVLVAREGAAVVITINRPDVRNALNAAARAQLQAALENADADPDVRAVILTGAGGTFCAGQDLAAAAAGEAPHPSRAAAIRSFTRSSIGVPVIAAVEGFAVGGGFELALGCDLIVAADDAQFGLPEVRHGLVAIGGGLIRLPQRIPYHVAMAMALTGDRYPTAELARWGVVTSVTAPGAAVAGAQAVVERIRLGGPRAIRATKEIIRRAHEWSGESNAFDAARTIADQALGSPERDEGIRAFLDRRVPSWQQRG